MKWLLFSVLIILSSGLSAEPRIVVKGLFSDRALIDVGGNIQLLKVGASSEEGVLLVAADSLHAEIEYQGKRRSLTMVNGAGASGVERKVERQDRIGGAEVRITTQKNGQYLTPGKINDRWVEFMIDTGATKISMNSFIADQLNIDYKRRGERVSVETANGNAQAHIVILNQVAIGSLVVKNPEAYIIEGRYPQRVLLGNSFLSEVSMLMEKGVMVLKSTD